MATQYTYSEEPNFHVARSRGMLKDHPELKDLMGPYPLTCIGIVFFLAVQFGLGYLMIGKPWWVVLITAYVLGAVVNHSLFAMVHEASHDLLWKSKTANKIWGLLSNSPHFFPSAMAFRKYHLVHHASLSEYEYDADMASPTEANLVGNSAIRKAIWYFFFGISQGFRPARLTTVQLWDVWVVINFVYMITINLAVYFYMGPMALLYFFLATIFGLGLHPVGGRWIQEHFVFKEGQETYSYYGILNKVNFNIGMHVEHHDLFRVPWIHLPKLRKIAPEYFKDLYAHQSWTKCMLTFIFDPKMDLYSRYARKTNASTFELKSKAQSPREEVLTPS